MSRKVAIASSEPIVWLVEREYICPRRFVPIVAPPSATKEGAEKMRDNLTDSYLYRVAQYRRIPEKKK